MIRQYELIDKVRAYDPNLDVDALNRAYVYAMKAHGSQTRESGDPYFSHPLEVANILTEMKLDTATIITALLHDTVEDTHSTLEEIEELFGPKIASLVDGVTKLTKIKLQSVHTKQAENFRKLVLAMSNDIRVLLVKLADRVHNMRTLSYVKSPEKRKRVALETMEIYAPLAGRIGVQHIKNELEDLAFSELNSEARQSILTRLDYLRKAGYANIEAIKGDLLDLLKVNNLKGDVSGREKSPYSIWRKMRRQNIGFEQLADIMAFRIVVEDLPECYQALGIIHSHYKMLPNRFKDYISTPKPNNYRSIHSTVIGPYEQCIEIQIRTSVMHEVNEYGVAAHWKYKQQINSTKGEEYRWLRALIDILEQATDPEEFMEHTKLEMFQDQVFCFTPKGDLIALPNGATVIDFAYAVHTEVGNHCFSSRINGRMVPLRTILKNGDQVEITTAKSQHPSPAWERYAYTGKARACIRRFIRAQKRTQFVELGKAILHKTFKQENIPYREKDMMQILTKFECQNLEDLFGIVGEGRKTAYDVIRLIYPEHQPKKMVIPKRKVEGDYENSISIKGLIPGMAVHYAKCCHPLPGDKIVGIVVTGRGVTIHTNDCVNLKRFLSQPERWVNVEWNTEKIENKKNIARLHVILINRVGSLANLTTLIGKSSANILNFKILNRSERFFEINFDVEVDNVDHLENIMAIMRSSEFINYVERAKNM